MDRAFQDRVVRTERRLLREALESGDPVGSVIARATLAEDRFDRTVEEWMESAPPPKELACQKGCAWCCYEEVWVTVPEVLRLARHLRATRTTDELEALTDRVAETARRIEDMDRIDRLKARIPCPLLEDDACSVYEARPLTCRGTNSFDADACEASLEEPEGGMNAPSWPLPGRLASVLQQALIGGLRDVGLEGAFHELIAALDIALRTPDAGTRWRDGEPVFAPARIELTDEQEAVLRRTLASTDPGA